MYAASVWAPAANKLGVKKQLGAVQRGIAQKMCRAYRTVSLNSALALAGILPLDLRVREAALLYEARRGVPQPELGGWEVERMAPATEAPHPAERLDLEITNLANEEELGANSGSDVRIFTDGSKIESRVGAALSIWNGEREAKTLKLALSKHCTVYQAELLAISRATGEILRQRASTYGIYSDSKAALQTIQNQNCFHPLAVEARKNIRAASLQKKVISFFWIKAHAGMEGNERADELAKEAALNSKKKPDYDMYPVSFVKRNIRMDTLDEWNRRYTDGETAKITKIFFPDVRSAYKIARLNQITGTKTQVMTGHGGFSEYLFRFKCKDSPACTCDPAKSETIPHLLLECPIYGRERHEIEQALNMKLESETIKDIMIGKDRDRFLNYCTKIAERVIKRNKTV